MRYVAMAYASSRRLGWIALALYIQRMKMPLPKAKDGPFYKSLIEYHRAMGNVYHFVETCMGWADDFRMAMYQTELVQRLDAIEDNWGTYLTKQSQKNTIMRKAQRARRELENAWIK